MSVNQQSKILAPYGALKFASLSTKVGDDGKGKPDVAAGGLLAPYGALKFAPLSTKVGGKAPPAPAI